ncbi:MAG: GspE/PulE family protein [Patescibacteria group bacterium]|jgi:type IV pilus assembly protein PilB
MPDQPAQNIANQTIADILLKKQVINQQVYDLIKTEQVNTGKDQEAIILDRGLVDPRNLVLAKSEYYQIPFVDIRQTGSNPQALTLIPQTVAQRFVVFPYDYNPAEKKLFVAMENPVDIATLDFLENKSKCQVVPAFGVAEDIKTAIAEKYSQGLSTEVDAAVREVNQSNTRVIDAQSISNVIREAPIAKIVTTLLSFAMKSLSSDIHIEPMEDKTRVRYRIDGILHEKLVLPKNVHDAVISRIKILAGMKIDEKRIPQDGRFTFRADKDEVDLRVSSLPSTNGEKIVMRLLKKSGTVPTLAELGLRGRALKNLEEASHIPHGVILITGPTGSGKTTTLYSLLHSINSSKVNIITLEDPVEYEMEGVNQVQINPVAGLTFASGLRSILRQDPNIIMVGEIRDSETAELAIQASLTGHLVFSTLHTNSAAGALPRLIDMEVEPFLLASAINCIVGQRVVRKICPHCKESFTPPKEIVESMRRSLGPLFKNYDTPNLQLYRGRRCSQCNDTGYSGRVGIFEVMPVTEKIGMLTVSHAPSSDIEKAAIENGMITMELDGYLKVLEGITTIEEVMRVAKT